MDISPAFEDKYFYSLRQTLLSGGGVLTNSGSSNI